MAAHAAEMGQPALGLTDHGVMNGAVDLYKACKKHGIKPIAGSAGTELDRHVSIDVSRTASGDQFLSCGARYKRAETGELLNHANSGQADACKLGVPLSIPA